MERERRRYRDSPGGGSIALDVYGTSDLPEPSDRVAPPTLITTTTGMAALKDDHPADPRLARLTAEDTA
jgi:hypothetical protein